jgi:cell division protein FtsZ
MGHPLAQAAQAAPLANPVGDVHERIRRMLTEGPAEAAPLAAAAKPAAPAQPVAPAVMPAPRPSAESDHARAAAHRNPFREAAEELQRTSAAALDLLKSLNGPKAEEPRSAAQEPAIRAAKSSHGDLFDEDDDGELEIPSFLRKKKIS